MNEISSDPYSLTAAEMAALPEHMRYPHAYSYNCHPGDRADHLADEVAKCRLWLAAYAAGLVTA